jgi:twitching motility protein PilT
LQAIEKLLEQCVKVGGSDLHFKSDTGKIYIRVNGDLELVEDAGPFTDAELRAELYKLLRPEQVERYERDLDQDFSVSIPGLSRFRGNIYQQRGHIQAAFRVIPYEIQTMEDLQLPSACYDFVERPRGLVLVTGPAGSGKSTSLAAMIDRINRTQPVHVVTVEDPVEFVHDDKEALINQRELDIDTLSFANALKFVLRQDPDVILVGEMRDLDTIHLAITAAETGHLVFATLHTVDAVQTVDRIVDVFPTHQQQQIRMQLSVNLVGVVSQTLVRRSDSRGRVAAYEVLVATGAVRNLIRENKSYQISSLIQTGARAKMNTLDQSLSVLVEKGIVSLEEARTRAKDAGEFDRLVALAKVANAMPAEQKRAQGPPSTGVRGQPNRPGYRRE